MSTPKPAGTAPYRRSVGTARGLQRRQQLLDRVTDDLAENGLADFSLRRAARAAGTTHKVLLYHFDGIEDLLRQALLGLRDRRIDNALIRARAIPTLAGRVRAIWPVLADDATGLRVIDQAIGLAMYDPKRYRHLARDAADQYIEPLESLCPSHWPAARRREVAELMLAAMRGFLVEWRTNRDSERIDAGLAALERALDREEAAG
ncbi:TetR/AcrR family transcriptional regulator [Microlunatus sp. Gsoil 973]|jgi:AcrR family transcriptional regulator|uniref:TetR/AcrR family transcriptional regulator n=1 Tax=Microlunatus sp. Gsoil 973 TaxID=2672569 RepID=UPI0012B4B0EF|nr:TetR family transcriptional regulator [Microlunatus sp. Gsoil 973]QGN33070.1 TetR family transcriptional regulator [Microlunatus sp. Gsoil 973]